MSFKKSSHDAWKLVKEVFQMKKMFTIVVAFGVLPMLACSPVETQARDSAAALSGSIIAAQTRYQASCAATRRSKFAK